jgi:dsRNA-specific ribonuclease
MADLWESLIAAIFKDSGWKGLKMTIGSLLQPFLLFFYK